MFKKAEHAGGEVTRYRMARILLGKPVYIGSAYRVGDALIDTGPPNKVAELRHALRAQPVRTILVTHGHEDHYGNAGAFPQARVLGAPGLRLAAGIPFYRKVAWGEPLPAKVEALGEAVELGGLEFLPLPTPGHTPDHLAYWVPERGWLYAGDAALGPLKYGFRDEDIHAYLGSLKAMRDLKPAMVFPAHGPVLEQPQEQLGAQIAHLEKLRDEVRRLAREGLGEGAIALRLLGRDGLLGRVSGGEFSKKLLVRGLLREPGR